MNRLSALLALLLVVCSMALVTSQHRARTLFTQIERANAQSAKLESRWDELLVRQTELAKASLIDVKARGQLDLAARRPERTMHLLLDEETLLAARHATLRWRADAVARSGP